MKTGILLVALLGYLQQVHRARRQLRVRQLFLLLNSHLPAPYPSYPSCPSCLSCLSFQLSPQLSLLNGTATNLVVFPDFIRSNPALILRSAHQRASRRMAACHFLEVGARYACFETRLTTLLSMRTVA